MLEVTLGAAATSFSTKSQTVDKSLGKESSTFVGQAGNTYHYFTPLAAAICDIPGGFKSLHFRNRSRPGTWETTKTILNLSAWPEKPERHN